LLVLIAAAYLVVAALFAVYTPAWQAPDEPAHYNYVVQVAENGCCPVIEMGDWNLPYQSELTGRRFAPELLGELDTLQYEDHQPPLYYLLASVVFKLAGGSLTGLRLFSALIGLGVVLCAYGIGKAMYPERPWIALGAAAFVAFLPQHVAIMAAVNNDGLAEVVIGVTLLAAIRYLKASEDTATGSLAGERTEPSSGGFPQRTGQMLPASGVVWTKNRDYPSARSHGFSPLLLGVLVGVGFLTKASTYFLVVVAPLAVMLKWRMEYNDGAKRALPTVLARLALFFMPALLLGAIWWARNLGVYGWPDFLGLGRHDVVVADQLRTADYIADNGWPAYLNRAFWETFNSFWGQFGWMAAPMPAWVYRIIQILLLVIVSGWALEWMTRRRNPSHSELGEGATLGAASSQRWRRWSAWVLLGVTLLLALAAFAYYNTEFVQHQGRYLFPALIPLALWMARGVDAWRLVVERGVSGRIAVRPYMQWLVAVAFLPLAALDVYLLWRVIVPGLSPP
jgi:hypothetical protein